MGFVKFAAAAALSLMLVAPAMAADAALLEQRGETGVHEIKGTVEWRQTIDAEGQPGVTAIATIPEGNLAAEVILTINSDLTLPVEHLFQVTFAPGTGFAGNAVVEMAGLMMRSGDDLQGTPMVGAAARIVDNVFLFAPSDAADANAQQLANSAWMDLALVFETGQRALLALRIDDTARAALVAMAL